jgi:hypothetical protein
MKKLFLIALSLKEKIFGPKETVAQNGNNNDTQSLKSIMNRFYSEGFSFWKDPYDTYRRNFTVRAGP